MSNTTQQGKEFENRVIKVLKKLDIKANHSG